MISRPISNLTSRPTPCPIPNPVSNPASNPLSNPASHPTSNPGARPKPGAMPGPVPRPLSSLAGPALLLLAALGLGGCDDAGERAEAGYRRALALAAQGDTAGAARELRDALRADGGHAGARLAYADLLRAGGEDTEALRQYLRAADLAPGSLAAWSAAATLALRAGDLTTAGDAAAAALRIDPADPAARSVRATLDFRQPATRAGAVEMAQGVLRDAPGDVPAHLVLIADRMNAGDTEGARARVEAALAAVPGNEELHLTRLALLEQAGETEAAGAALRTMAGLFPDNAGIRLALARWHLRAGDPDGAEAALRAARDHAAINDPADPEIAHALVLFLIEQRGPEAALAEIGRITTRDTEAQAPEGGTIDPRPFLRLRAGLLFDEGDRAGAIAELRALTEGAAPSDETRASQLMLARMLAEPPVPGAESESGEVPDKALGEARRLLDAVLAGDPGLPEALRLRARLALDAGEPDRAIIDLRAAEAGAPDDPGIMTLMALAHDQAGSPALAGERLARAVALSRQAPETSLRHARFLMRENRPGPAESVILSALRATPEDPDLLDMLGRIHVARENWSGAAGAAERLRAAGAAAVAAGSPSSRAEAEARAVALELASLRGQDKARARTETGGVAGTGDMAALLEDLALGGANGLGDDKDLGDAGLSDEGLGADGAALVARVRALLAAGESAAARRVLTEALGRDAADPGADDPAAADLSAADLSDADPGPRLMLAELTRRDGDADGAERLYRALTAERPELARGWLGLADLLRAAGRGAEADRVLDAGIAATARSMDEATPGSPSEPTPGAAGGAMLLLVARAAELERRGDAEGAIALYEALHARDPSAAVIANNLASLLSSARADPESLARAEAIARRFAASGTPAFRDTYGWILFRRGAAAEALAHLAPAAEAMPGDARVWLHRAEAEFALGRDGAARASYAHALRAAEADAGIGGPEAAAARARLATLDAAAEPGQGERSEGN